MFSGHTKKLFVLLLIIFSNNLALSKINQIYTKNNPQIKSYQTINQIKETEKNKDIDPISLTARRIIFKSFIKSVWKMAETRYKTNSYVDIKYKLGEVASSLIIDEALPSEKQNNIQKISERLVPIIISECILYQYNNSLRKKHPDEFNKQHSNDLIVKILTKLLEKTVKSNFFLDKKNKYYNLSRYSIVYPAGFIDTKNLNCSLRTGTKNVINETVKTVIASKQINLGKALNKKHRKKAIAKAINIMLEPLINGLFD